MKKLSNQLLADTISAKRKELNLTQTRLSEFTGINRSMIGRIENLEYTPTINQLEKLAEVLDFDLTNLFVEGASDSTDSTPMKKYNIAVDIIFIDLVVSVENTFVKILDELVSFSVFIISELLSVK